MPKPRMMITLIKSLWLNYLKRKESECNDLIDQIVRTQGPNCEAYWEQRLRLAKIQRRITNQL